MPRRIVLFELNEVPWRIVDEFVAAEPHSALARILSTSRCFTSLTADHGHLSPWTTWPTLHRGVNDEQHMIANFGQNRSVADEQFPPVWELLHRAGVPVGICGTLHTYPVPADVQTYSFYLPDTFASEPTAFPAELETFQAFNLTMARASSRNVDTAIPRGAALTLLRSAHRLGIRPGTFGALAQQLVAERRKPWLTTRRRSFQSLLAFDVFDTQLRRHRPAFSSFFSNHVASAMHRYWAAGHPADYDQLNLGEEWLERYRGEVPWAMQRADEMIARLADFVQANPGSELWIASSMGQGPTFAQPLETQLYLACVHGRPGFGVGPRAGRSLDRAAGDAAATQRPGRPRVCRRIRGRAAQRHRRRRATGVPPCGRRVLLDGLGTPEPARRARCGPGRRAGP